MEGNGSHVLLGRQKVVPSFSSHENLEFSSGVLTLLTVFSPPVKHCFFFSVLPQYLLFVLAVNKYFKALLVR